ncbi:CAP domain-containing protein [Flectobacillus major]|uniref:CAP domain-containing protein n=1 Tax=Flectobacillus major TaxID=103 RepID=UPI000427902F|nr:CAP domain-containing protein [Flectobacillus major]
MLLFFHTFLLWIFFFQNDTDYYTSTSQAFFQTSEVNEAIDVLAPNYALLDACIFHQTNRVRQQYGLPLLKYRGGLHKAARLHSESMISHNFYAHINPYSPEYASMEDRIEGLDRKYYELAENVAQVDLLATPSSYCPVRKKNGEYLFLNCETQKPLSMLTYKAFAEEVLKVWMQSKGHRQNVLHQDMYYLGCAGQICKNPYASVNGPFARLTQEFAGKHIPE